VPGGKTVACCLAAAALCAFGCLGGCTAEDRYPVLAFFFDGVPAPGSAPRTAASGRYVNALDLEQRGVVSQPSGFRHTPFGRGQCNGCHPETRSLFLGEERRKGLCFSCHEHDKFRTQVESYAFVHGPVAAEACQVCHDPHESLYKGVLVSPDPKLCRDCHDILTGASAPFHHSSVKDECLPCHDPHGGSNRFFVKEGVGKGAEAPKSAVEE
jgi:predicted CXXCH cytochrome family protein